MKRNFLVGLPGPVTQCPCDLIYMPVILLSIGFKILGWFIENRLTDSLSDIDVSKRHFYRNVDCERDLSYVTQISDTDNIGGCENSLTLQLVKCQGRRKQPLFITGIIWNTRLHAV
jgi:hypothetical protein